MNMRQRSANRSQLVTLVLLRGSWGLHSKRRRFDVESQLFVSNLLTKFGMHNCKTASTLLPEKCALSKDDNLEDSSEDASENAGCDYRRLVGSISCLAMTTRPDLAFAAHLLSRFLNKPSLVHWKAAKHVLRDLRGTEDVGITYWRNCGDT